MSGEQESAATKQCEYDDCPRDALVRLVTEVQGIAREEHELCDEHAEAVRNSPVSSAEVVEEEQLNRGEDNE